MYFTETRLRKASHLKNTRNRKSITADLYKKEHKAFFRKVDPVKYATISSSEKTFNLTSLIKEQLQTKVHLLMIMNDNI